MEAIYGTDIPTAVFSGVAMVWAGALIVLDKRHAIRHTLTMLSGALLLASQICDFFYSTLMLYSLFAATARYLLWCISYAVVLDCVPGSRRSLQRIIPIIAFTWSAIGTLIMVVYVIMYATGGYYYNDAVPILSRIGWYGSVPLILGLYILSFDRDYKLAIRDFSCTFAVYILLLTTVSVGVIVGTVSFLVGRILSNVVMSITLVYVCYCAPRWVGVKHDRLADRNDDEEDNPFVPDGTQNPDTQNPDYRYDPDDVYTKEAHDLGRY
ncbi:predicted protein [Lichtheimia corymbifera JMRC:FSU:9682]|uniref:Uncharacterized protein n=1 Tax=Lichtheimia corymbifera JMRC:FSU:9682 TaxID=1263082 RepID=A0A068RVB9_9FUNG|nr:predicted protein [Lichtheimia corymbifera JMRC:FSU:9682]